MPSAVTMSPAATHAIAAIGFCIIREMPIIKIMIPAMKQTIPISAKPKSKPMIVVKSPTTIPNNPLSRPSQTGLSKMIPMIARAIRIGLCLLLKVELCGAGLPYLYPCSDCLCCVEL